MDRWERTHDALARAALELFTEQGYDATRTAQIAARAGVSEMTLFRHFSAKEALLLEDPFDPLMAVAVRARPPEEPPMRALAEGIRETWDEIDPCAADALRSRLRILAGVSGLAGAIERSTRRSVAALAEALRDRGVESASAEVAASAMLSGLGAALLTWARSESAVLDEAVGRALDVLGGE